GRSFGDQIDHADLKPTHKASRLGRISHRGRPRNLLLDFSHEAGPAGLPLYLTAVLATNLVRKHSHLGWVVMRRAASHGEARRAPGQHGSDPGWRAVVESVAPGRELGADTLSRCHGFQRTRPTILRSAAISCCRRSTFSATSSTRPRTRSANSPDTNRRKSVTSRVYPGHLRMGLVASTVGAARRERAGKLDGASCVFEPGKAQECIGCFDVAQGDNAGEGTLPSSF